MRHGLRAYIELEVLLVERPYQVSASGCMVLVCGQMALRQQSMRGQESGRMGWLNSKLREQKLLPEGE